jgi:hypothetical protein
MNPEKHRSKLGQSRRRDADEFKDEAVQLMMDGRAIQFSRSRSGWGWPVRCCCTDGRLQI